MAVYENKLACHVGVLPFAGGGGLKIKNASVAQQENQPNVGKYTSPIDGVGTTSPMDGMVNFLKDRQFPTSQQVSDDGTWIPWIQQGRKRKKTSESFSMGRNIFPQKWFEWMMTCKHFHWYKYI